MAEAEPAQNEEEPKSHREHWDNPLEFLMSCIALSVGLGNVWRFPFTAYENGGGAFLIPYILVLCLIGRPMYMLEMGLGQFTTFSAVKIWSVIPAYKGLGWAMAFATTANLTYYCALMSVTLLYFVMSFAAELPWAVCDPEWGELCFDSKKKDTVASVHNYTSRQSSSELFFLRKILREKDNIDDGLGWPDWRLTIGLLLSWVLIFLIIMRGVSGSGKAAYFLALFPYVVLTALLIRGATLPGATKGMLFFLKPQWGELLNPTIWYAAVTQAFFSLSISFGSLVMYSSHNKFSHNIYRDALIVTSMDTFTSLLAGFTIFAILGNLAHEMKIDDISNVIQSGMGLAFISYPDAISKFQFVPQLFAVLFFLMLYTLGMGSAVALSNAAICVFCDHFPRLKYWQMSLIMSVFGFCTGLFYITPGGQWIVTLVDYYCVTFVVFVLAVIEIIGLSWVYGFDNYCRDIQFMIGRKLGIYWRFCWGFVTPVGLIIIFVYYMALLEPVKYQNKKYPLLAYVTVVLITALGVAQVPIWFGIEMYRSRDKSFKEMMKKIMSPNENWGPKDPEHKADWIAYKERKAEEDKVLEAASCGKRTWWKFTGWKETL